MLEGERSPEGAQEDALVVVMPGPRSFTGEDVVELHVHAGVRNVRQVVDGAVAMAVLHAEKRPELADLATAVRTEQDGTTVRVTAAYPLDALVQAILPAPRDN